MPNEHIASAQHEFRSYAWYVGDLTPYWIMSGAIQGEPFEGADDVEYDIPIPGGETERWEFSLDYQEGSLAPRADMSIPSDAMREWRLTGRGPGQKKASFHIKPRWEGQRLTDGSEFRSPWTGLFRDLPEHVDEGVEVTYDGSNVEPEVYPHILDQACERIAVEGGMYWGDRYFAEDRINHRSPISTTERYMRVDKGMGKKLVRQDGYFGRLARLLTGEEPARAIWDIDNTETLGYLHTFRYDAATARELLPGEQYGKQLKHYHPKYVRTSESGDALEHPKVGALFKKGKNGENTFKLNQTSVRWGDIDKLTAELEDTLINTLERAGIPTDAPTSFVADDHFQVEVTDRRVELHPDPTDDIVEKREASVAAAFREMTGAGQDVAQVMADGGDEMHVEELADQAEVSVSSVYRVLDRMQGVLENENGIVRWASRKAAEDIRSILDLVESSSAPSALLATVWRGCSASTSAFSRRLPARSSRSPRSSTSSSPTPTTAACRFASVPPPASSAAPRSRIGVRSQSGSGTPGSRSDGPSASSCAPTSSSMTARRGARDRSSPSTAHASSPVTTTSTRTPVVTASPSLTASVRPDETLTSPPPEADSPEASLSNA